HQIGYHRADLLERLLAIMGLEHLEALDLQIHPDRIQQPRLVVDEKDLAPCALHDPFRGSEMKNVLPRPAPSDSTHTRPLCASTITRQIYRPIPTPAVSRLKLVSTR